MLLSSCQQDESSYALATSAEDAAREIGFISMDVSKSKSRSSVGVKINDDLEMSLIAKIARPKTGCTKGFGLCDPKVVEFNSQDDAAQELLQNIKESAADKYVCTTTCKIDSVGHGKVVFLLADEPKTQGLTAETMPLFYVDEDVEQPVENNLRNTLIILNGAYEFDQSLGTHGGYVVDAIYQKHE